MPRTEVMLVGSLDAGFPGAGGPIPPTFRPPYNQPRFRMNRHMPIPSTYGQPQNLLKVSDKTNYNPRARASGGRPVTSALGSVGRKLVSPLLGNAAEPAPPSYEAMVDQSEYWRTSYIGASVGVMVLGATMASIHGYRRNKGKTGYAVLWGVAGAVFPILTNGVALVQGYAKPGG